MSVEIDGIEKFERLFEELDENKKREEAAFLQRVEEERLRIASEMKGFPVTDDTIVTKKFALEVEDRFYRRENALVKPSDLHGSQVILTPGANDGTLIGEILNAAICTATEVIEDYNSENSERAYQGDLVYWRAWLKANGISTNTPIGKEHLILFIVQHIEEMPSHIDDLLVNATERYKSRRGVHKVSTVERRIASLSRYLGLRKLENPCSDKDIRILLRKLTEKHGSSKAWGRAITLDILKVMLCTCDNDGLIGIRDAALILFGFSTGGRRRSEISQASIDNLSETSDGSYLYNLSKSKTNKTGNEDQKPIKGVAATALKKWIKASGITEGKVFRGVPKGGKKVSEDGLSAKQVSRIIKSRCEKAGYDPDMYTAHSLRSGFITESGRQGKPLGDVMALSGHRSVATAMQYYQAGAVLNNSAADLAG